MSRAETIELALWRSRLLRDKFARGAFQDACKVAARLCGAIDRAREAECNGLPKDWNPVRREYNMGLTQEDGDKLAATIEKAQKGLQEALKPFLTPGCLWTFYSDPRADVARIYNRANTLDAFI